MKQKTETVFLGTQNAFYKGQQVGILLQPQQLLYEMTLIVFTWKL